MKEILRIKNLTKYYGKTLGVKNINLSLFSGEIFGFIGPNGAGKSTTIRSIINLINKSSGEIYYENRLLDKNNINDKYNIGYLPSEINLYDDLTVKQILDFHESFYKKNCQKRKKELISLLKIDQAKKINELSFGNKKKLGIILALMHEPKLVIFDEATSGLDPIVQKVLYDILLEEKAKGTTILYSTHILSEIPKICDRVGIIKEGKLIEIASIEELKNKMLKSITIEANDIKSIIKDLKINEYSLEKNKLVFRYSIDENKLIKILSKYEIDKLLIEEVSLDELFLHYYN